MRIAVAMALVFASECGAEPSEAGRSPSNHQTVVRSRPVSVETIVDELFADVSAMAKDYPELTQFPMRARPTQESGRVEVRYSHNARSFSEMRETRPSDLGTNGIKIIFMVLDEPNRAWTTAAAPPVPLKALRKSLYKDFVLSPNPSPGLREKLGSLLDIHAAALLEMERAAAHTATNDMALPRRP